MISKSITLFLKLHFRKDTNNLGSEDIIAEEKRELANVFESFCGLGKTTPRIQIDNHEPFQDVIIKAQDTKHAYLFAKEINNADIAVLENVIINN